jgi:hypothetical protein
MSRLIDVQATVPQKAMAGPPHQTQTPPDQIWEQLSPAQQQQVFRMLTIVCRSLGSQPKGSPGSVEAHHD